MNERPTPPTIWNAGEKELQTRAGVRGKLEAFGGRIMRPTLGAGPRELLGRTPFLVLAGMSEGWPVSAIVSGAAGWATTPDDRTLRLDVGSRVGDLGDLAVGDRVAILAIELAMRRRIRVNGRVAASAGGVLTIAVDVCFGNCPQYIQAREVAAAAPHGGDAQPEGSRLGADALAIVTRADTFFIASAARPDPAAGPVSEGVDVSHRGGRPGFVTASERDGVTLLAWPDYPGNDFFNTLGNLALYPRAGLLFVDFERGDVLTVTGSSAIVRVGEERDVHVRVDHARLIRGALPLRFSAPELAPELE